MIQEVLHDVSILYYLVEVTSPSGFVCPPEQCNVTANTTTITGLNCSTDYSFTVIAVNCVGNSTVSNTKTVTTTSSKFLLLAYYALFLVNNVVKILLICKINNSVCDQVSHPQPLLLLQ